MSIKFSYPNEASPTTEVTFGDIEGFPYSRPLRRLQSTYDTDAGATVIYDWGAKVETFTISLFPLSVGNVNALSSFFDVTANGRANTWDYTDSRGITYTVRFAQDVFQATERSYNRAQVSLTLRVI